MSLVFDWLFFFLNDARGMNVKYVLEKKHQNAQNRINIIIIAVVITIVLKFLVIFSNYYFYYCEY